MQFIRVDDLKVGMRLARPIYNKQGVLLFERNSRLSVQGIISVRNFGLLGIFILEPAEPVPPMTKEDIEFERFQTVAVFSIQEELERIAASGKPARMEVLIAMITKNYGHLDKKINLIQSLRSREDYLYKHTLNTAILCAMITHVLNVRLEDTRTIIKAAIVHDIGKLTVLKDLSDRQSVTPEMKQHITLAEVAAYDQMEKIFSDGNTLRRICSQSQKLLEDLEMGTVSDRKTVIGAHILAVADTYDMMTAMNLGKAPESEVRAIKFLLGNPHVFKPAVVQALIQSINILFPGVSVELNTGEKATVLVANEDDILRPVILSFVDNSVIDLGNKAVYDDLEITDIMKTLDNRYIFDTESLRRAGLITEIPQFEAIREKETN